MANPDRPQGFRPLGPVEKSISMVAGSEVYPGDFVALAADGAVDPAAAGAVIFGLALNHAEAGEDVSVVADADQLYVGQADETEIDAQTDVGNLCDIVATAGDATYDASRQEIDSSTIGTGSGGQLVIMGIRTRPDNALGAQADVIVRINEKQVIGEDDFAGI